MCKFLDGAVFFADSVQENKQSKPHLPIDSYSSCAKRKYIPGDLVSQRLVLLRYADVSGVCGGVAGR